MSDLHELITLPGTTASLGQGSSGEILPGTGTSVPGGVESTLEYNGLAMNVRSWWDTYLVTNLEGLGDADIRDSREVNPADHGETPFSSYYGGRTITISGKIRAHTIHKLRDMIQGLRSAFQDISKEYPLRFVTGDTSRDVVIYCKKIQPINIPETQTDFRLMRDFQVALRASNPRFMSWKERYIPLTAGATLPLSTDVLNLGNSNAQPRFQIIGPITNPVITNTTTGKVIALNTTITVGNTWTVDVGKKTITDQNGVNRFSALDITTDWVELIPGTNTIQLTGSGHTAGQTQLFIFNRDVWM
jgi:phage-related protein